MANAWPFCESAGQSCSGTPSSEAPVRIVKDAHLLHLVQKGDILVTDKTDPDWEPVMKKAAAIVNHAEKRLSDQPYELIAQSCDEILAGQHHDMFPLHVWMTGSGT